MLELRRELLWLLEPPAAQIMFALRYLHDRYGQIPPDGYRDLKA